LSEFFFECFVGLLLRKSESKTTSQPTFVFFVESTKMVFAVVVPRACFVLLGTVSLTLPDDSLALFVLRVSRARRAFHASRQLRLFLLLVFAFFC
jgi:hypothetical protein